ncbi:MAG: ABC transporter substrate-binding protein [Candidatus Coatesbacteria bacterium]|nr:ABC transporter substrate-binding protein [Candidatus Coatesbacteria bacterium]
MFSPLLGCRKPAPPEAQALDAASGFYADGQFSRARDEIKLLLRKDISPELRAEAVLLDGVILLSMGDFDGAATSLDTITQPPSRLKPEVDYALAKALIFAGRLERAKHLIDSMKASEPTPGAAARLQLLDAFLATKSGEFDGALDLADAVIWSSSGVLRSEGQFVKGFSLFQTGRFAESLDYMNQAIKGLRPGYERFVSSLIAARSAESLNRHEQSIDLFMAALSEVKYLADPADFEASIKSSIERQLSSRMEREDLQSVIDRSGAGFPADAAAFALAKSLIRDGRHSDAEQMLARFSERFPDSQWADAARDVRDMIVMGMLGDPQRIGLIAPLSGDLADFGQEVLLGAKMAISDYCAASDATLSLIVRDSKDDPDLAAEAFVDLAENEKVIAIIGPVLSKSLSDVSSMATEYRVLTFSPSACALGALGASRYTFRNCLPLWTQARAIAQFAVKRLHLLRIAVLMPEKEYGTLLVDSFVAAAQEAGAEVIFVKSYPADEMDFRDRLSGLCELEPEAIFIADYASQVSVIAPQVEYGNIHDAILLGWDGWNTASALAPVLAQLEGAFFVSGSRLDAEAGAGNRLQQRVLVEQNMDCSALLLQSYDAASILCKALWRGASYRQDLRDEVSRLKFRGVLGDYGFTASGQATRPMQVLTVANGQIVKVCDIEAN